MDNQFTFFYTITDIKECINECQTDTLLHFNQGFLDPNPSKHKLRILQQLYDIYCFAVPCKRAVQELSEMLDQEMDLDSESIRKWVEEYYLFYKAHLSLFCHQYQDETGVHDKDFYLSDFNLYIERKPFIPIIQFWYLMNTLYWGQYHLPKEQRKFEELSPNDYYYKELDPNAPSDLEVIKRILELT